ncbi:MAG TPA: mannitol dehydrogenase family protein [Sporichthya sp.]|nr:mannitol dehydrogenase family protein [Sporichthya sp.]
MPVEKFPQLSAATLASLAVPGPAYDRRAVRAGIVHIGVGNFHRAHEALYVDRLLAAGHSEWGICGVGTQPTDARMAEVLRAQDGLYTLVVRHADGSLEPRVIGSLVEYLYTPDDPEGVVERMADPATRIVSLTITEGGYDIDAPPGDLGVPDPNLLLDLQWGAVPRTAFGLLTESLARRRERKIDAFAVMSCDNLEGNGDIARDALVRYAARRDTDLAEWIGREVAFPNSMVDRITPVTTDVDRVALLERLGFQDGWPVFCESYTQWVLEDAFPAGRPPWEDVGVQLVPDVRPYELMKLRLLNAGHQALGYLGYLAGHRYTDETCRDPEFAAFLLAYMEHEALPTLPPVPGVDLRGYCRTLLERFANPHMRDTLARLCAESSDRIPKFVLPVIQAQLAGDGEFARAALVVAAWARYAEGVDERGEPILVIDRQLETVRAAAARSRAEPTAFLTDTGVFGELAADPRFVRAFTEQLDSLRAGGARKAVAGAV